MITPAAQEIPPPAERTGQRRSIATSIPAMLRQFVDVRRARATVDAPASLPLLSIETLVECNARCGICGYPSDYPSAGEALTTSELYQIVNDAAALGTLLISIGGGEPFLRADAEALIQHIDARSITPFIHSNGSLLSHDRCVRLAENSGLVLALSLDSNRRAVHDEMRQLACFDTLTSAARYFARSAPHVRALFTFTITGVNYRDMLGTMRLARDLGVRTVRFTPLHDNLQHRFKAADELEPFRMAPEALPELTDELERVIEFAASNRMVTNSNMFLRSIPSYFAGPVPHRCFAGFFFCSIDPYGNMFPCYDHLGAVDLRAQGGLANAFRSPEMNALCERVASCQNRCWNVGTAEPSLRMNMSSLASQIPQLARETLFFLP